MSPGQLFWEASGFLMLFMIVGMIVAYLDSKFGVGLRRGIHKMTHKDPLPESDQRGFIVGQTLARKISVATVISTLQSFYILFTAADVDLTKELIIWFFEAGIMVLGFHLVKPFIAMQKAFFARVAPKIDEMEQQQYNPDATSTAETTETSAKKTEPAPAEAEDSEAAEEPVSEPEEESVPAETPAPEPNEVVSTDSEEEPEFDHRDVLKNFGRKKA